MNHEDSILLNFAADQANKKIQSGEMPSEDFDQLVEVLNEACEHMVREARELAPQWYTLSAKASKLRTRWRRLHDIRVGRAIGKRYARAFLLFEESLGAAEFINLQLIEAYSRWVRATPESERMSNLFGQPNLFGGHQLKVLILLAMHARSIVIASEILQLLKAGFHEGAAARARTLYELSIKATLIAVDEYKGGYGLAERFYVSAHGDDKKYRNLTGQPFDDESQQVYDLAKSVWGSDFFSSEHNWARPIIPGASNRRLTFKDLEQAAGAEELRHTYLEYSRSVHAGPLTLIQGTDFNKRYLNNMRTEVDIHRTGRIGQSASFSIEVVTEILTKCISTETKEWDSYLALSQFVHTIDRANSTFVAAFEKCAPRQVE
ncbi:DUF5677 domain-containing protein [Actinokineospora globicatena]|uniref:Uncharacterized protein n=1 Tax=Actinokineospora globicatena TaxID=103729 RepID=A0A9W6QKS0_9PSEU|nr:DUF5677 domain-containing protein [Actinokineospora globicatena]GLW90294.1 hypothetical protein Aglo03_11100 [Actinokineospora globicatena]